MKAREFQYLASNLAEYGRSPSQYRTAISRTYYAAYNRSVELLENSNITIDKSAEGHQQVYLYFNNSGNKELQEVAQKLSGLRVKRNRADYRLDNPDVESKKNAKLTVQDTERILKTLDRVFSGKDSDQIVAAIRDYRRKTSGKKMGDPGS